MILNTYIYPREEFETEFDVFPPFVFTVTVVTIGTVFIKPLGPFEEYQWYVAVSLSFCRELTVDDSNSLLWIDRVYSDSGERGTKARDDEGG